MKGDGAEREYLEKDNLTKIYQFQVQRNLARPKFTRREGKKHLLAMKIRRVLVLE
jgi:hypothetical protein